MLLLASLPLTFAFADTLESLPDPLGLQQAMQLAEDPQYFELLEAQASIIQAESRVQQASSNTGFRAQLELTAAYIEPSPIAFDQSSNDSLASLRLSKSLYDFSGSNENIQAANIEHEALEKNLEYIVAQRKIEIARQFFEVILADLKYAWDNEAMAIAYVRFDADKDRYSLKQMSDVDFLQSENRYLETLHARNISETGQRHTRALLAELLNRADQLPSNLQRPLLQMPAAAEAEYSTLLEKLMLNNPAVQIAQQQLQAAEQRMAASQRQFYPRLDAEVTLSEYARETGSSDEWRAELNMVIPLYENSSIKAQLAEARANLMKQRANLQRKESTVRQLALKLWQTIDVLTKRSKQLKTTLALRELSLDKSRALYEMEVKTDLGDSMVAISEIQYKQAKNEFELMLAWMQLRLLMGETDLLQSTL